MCDFCDKFAPANENAPADPGYENLADYAAGVSGPVADYTRTSDIPDSLLAQMSDDDIDEACADRADEVSRDMKKKRDDAMEREYREEAHAEAAAVFRYHPAQTKATAEKHENVRNVCGLLAHRLIDTCPPSTELDTALDRLREVMFWANAAVALG